jgi:hypothetical protein
MGKCGCPQFQHWAPRYNSQNKTFFLPNPINDPTLWSTPNFHTGTSTFHDSFPLSNSADYTTQPSIQSSVWYSGTPGILSEPNPTIYSNAQSILYDPNPTTATKALQGIPFREVTPHNRISTKTKIKSSNTKSSDTTKISKKAKKSRRIIQRRYKRLINKTTKNIYNEFSNKLQQKNKFLESQYGFYANPDKDIRENFNTAMTTITPITHNQPTNLAFHNLCKETQLPLGAKQLLGLNLKFCLASNKLSYTPKRTLLNLAYTIRTKIHLKQLQSENNSEYIKQLYVKNRNWNPPPAPIDIENKLEEFDKALNKKHNELLANYQNTNLTNLTLSQNKTLKLLRQKKDIVIKPTDKNLGPAAMDKEAYIQQMIQEHLLSKDYTRLTKQEAYQKIELLRTKLKGHILSAQNSLSKAEQTYFDRSFKLSHRIPILYGLPKVHKIPMTLRPVVSSTNSLLSVFSTWLDFKTKELLPLIKSYTRNSIDIITDLRTLTLPKGAAIFSADAKSMYTNIDTELGISTFKDFLQTNQDKIPENFPTNLFLTILDTVMRNNIFSFADTYWHQLSGTAMGTPIACAYATISFGHYENINILTEFSPNLLYYRRYIDDIFGIWIPPVKDQNATWQAFKNKLNNWGHLEWVIEDPSKHTVFLDLDISTCNSKLIIKTFQKETNLYLYLPPQSAHPPSCLKGLISGELNRYWAQNKPSDFQKILASFIQRLTQRGHKLEDLIPIFQQAAASLETKNPRPSAADTDTSNTLFLHWQYHPHGIQKRELRLLYNNTLKPLLDYDRVTIAMSRPTNLRDLLTNAKLNDEISHLLDDYIESQTK